MRRFPPAVFVALSVVLLGCPQPQQQLPVAEPPHVDQSNFTSVVLEADKPVLVDFFATWCGPCRTMEPTIRQLAAQFEGRALVVKIDVDQNAEVCRTYAVTGYPTFLVFKNGQEVGCARGTTPKQELAGLIEAQLGG